MVMNKVRRVLFASGIALLTMTLALPALADPPIRAEVPFSGAVTDAGEACGDPLSWEFEGTVRSTQFVDDGNVVRTHLHVREFGTVTNLATGEVVDLPETAFLQRTLVVEDGEIIEVNGLSVRVTGPDDVLLDVGRFVLRLDRSELLQSSGQHPIREINPFSVTDPALLEAFCDLFD